MATTSGARRSMVLHWSLFDLDEIRDRLRASFTRAGFEVAGRGDTGPELSLTRTEPDGSITHVRARLTELDNPAPDPIVRGVLVLDLPVAARSSADSDCANPFVTKRFEQHP